MAIQILPREQGLGEMLGTGLGSGLSSGLQQLAQQKMQQLQSRQQKSAMIPGIKRSLGVNDEIANQLVNLPTPMLQEIFKTQGRSSREAGFQQALEGLGLGGSGAQQQAFGTEGIDQTQPQIQQDQEGGLLGRPQLSEKGATEIAKIKQEQSKEARKDVKQKWAFNKDYISESDKQTNTARKAISRYKQMRVLSEKGNLKKGLYHSLLKKTGLDIPAFMNADEETYSKLQNDFVSDIKNVFGARITEKMIEVYLKIIPTLQNSEEGKRRIIDIQELRSEAELSKGQAIQEIINENGGTPPYDLNLQVGKRMNDIYDNLAEESISKIQEAEQFINQQKSGTAFVGKKYKSSEIDRFPVGVTSKADASGNKWKVGLNAEGKKEWQLV